MSATVPTSPARTRWKIYALAVAVAVAALGIRLALAPWIDRPLLLAFVIPILVSAYFGGAGPGLTTTIILALGSGYFLLPPTGSFTIERPVDVALWSILIATGALVSVLNESLHRARRRAESGLHDLKQTEEALRGKERLLQVISDNSTTVIYAKNLAGRYLFVNRRYLEIFHLEPEAVLGRTDHDIFPAEAARAFRAVDERVAAANAAIVEEETAPHDDGLHTYVSVKCPLRDADGKASGVFGISTDITDRKRAENALRAGEERTRLILENALDAVITIDRAGVVTGWNPQAETTFGWAHAEAVGRALADLIIPERYREMHRRGMARYLATGEAVVLNKRIEITGLRRDGREIPVELAITPVRAGDTLSFSAFVRDITERKESETKVREQVARLDLLNRITRAIGERQDLESIFQVVMRHIEENLALDLCCMCLYDAAEHALTVARVAGRGEALTAELALSDAAKIPVDENGLGRCVRGQLVHEPDIDGVAFPFPQRLVRAGLRSLVFAPLLVESRVFGVFIAARCAANSFSSGECEFLKQLSEHVALAAHQAQLHGALQQAYDDLRNTQQAIMQQERLRALGQMASGIAHDINNAISPASLYAESLLESEEPFSPRARDRLLTIQRALDDVAQTVSRMREFYRQREPQLALAPVDLNRVVQQVVDLTRARWSDMPQQRGIVIALRLEPAAGLPAILGVESEIREALINLVFNAVDAMSEGGALTLRTSVVERGPAQRQARIEIIDTGLGMDEDTRRRCLEPFFTTKGERGTGLGLAMVYGIVQRHGADLDIESAPGRGTTVRLGFGLPTEAVSAGGPAVAPRVVPRRLRLLIVDDDPLLLKSLRDILEGDGHVVVAAGDGRTGIGAFQEALARNEPFAAVITDLGMPHIDGRKVAESIKAAAPATPVIMLTGWGQRLLAEGDVPSHVDRVLSKPPKLRELREALAECCATARQ